MNELLQSAQPLHPDADQLSAFAEQALPLHEQQTMLLHLAACADCRKIVLLAQQAEEDALPKPAPAAPRKPWLSGWNLAWPAAAALACAGVATVKLRTLHEAEHVAPPTLARMEGAAPPPAIAARPPAIAAPPKPESQAIVPPSIAAPKPLPMVVAKPAPPQTIKDLPVEGRSAASIATASVPPMALGGAIHGAVQAPSSRVTLGAAAGAGQAQGAMAQQQSLAATNNSMAALRARVSGPAQTQQANGGVQAYVQGAAAPMAKAAPQPVAVAAAPMAAPPPPPAKPAQVTNVDVLSDAATVGMVETKSNATLAGLAALPSSLPSHLAIRSSIANGGKTVAIDSNGQVFFSKDGGKKWQPVRVQWTGRAQQVSFEPAEQQARNVPQSMRESAAPAASVSGAESGNIVRMTIEHNRSLQDDFADIIGSVTDQSGAVIPGATVTVQEDVKEPTRNLRVTRTNAQGQYLLTAVPDGKLRLVIASPGFMTLTQTFEVVSRDRATFHSVLTVASSTQTVEVSAADSEIALDTVLKKKTSPAAFELTTDTGAIWTSTDGKKWKQK